MSCDLHLPFWPAHAPKHLWVPETHLYRNVEVAAMRFPDKPFVIFYDTAITYREFQHETFFLVWRVTFERRPPASTWRAI